MDTGHKALVGDEQQRQPRRLVDAAALGLDDAVLDLVAHSQSVAPADAVRFQHQLNQVREGDAVERHRMPLLEAHRHLFAPHLDVVAPERDAHDRLHDLHRAAQVFQVLGFMRRAQHVGVG